MQDIRIRKKLYKVLENDFDFEGQFVKSAYCDNDVYENVLSDFLNNFETMKPFMLDKKYIDITWIVINNKILDLDAIYNEWEAYIA